MERTVDISWQKIFDDCKLNSHDFTKSPYMIDCKKNQRNMPRFFLQQQRQKKFIFVKS